MVEHPTVNRKGAGSNPVPSAFMIIGFTGHRNRLATKEQLIVIEKKFGYADLWLHGGARKGFDHQVDNFAKSKGIPVEKITPNYRKYPPKFAPIARNRVIVDRSDIIVALWDGRKTGGTYSTIQYAKKHSKPVIILKVS